MCCRARTRLEKRAIHSSSVDLLQFAEMLHVWPTAEHVCAAKAPRVNTSRSSVTRWSSTQPTHGRFELRDRLSEVL